MTGTAARSGPDHPIDRTLVGYAYELMDESPTLSREDLMSMICKHALALSHADGATLWTRNVDGKRTFKKVAGVRPSATAIALERDLVNLVGDEARVVSSAAPPMRPRLMELCEELRQERSGVVGVDLHRGKESLAVLFLHRIGGGSFTAAELADAERFALFAALAINELAERERAERDEVTGMPGRTLLLRSLEEWYARGLPFALACVDFDGLKAVNETKGYDKGNDLICAVAGAIEKLLRDGELVGRLHGRGGDEFVCLLKESNQEALDTRCQLLEAALDRADVPDELASSYLGVSIGAALANTTAPVGDLFTAAESRMRQRKQERRRSQGRQAPDDRLTLSLSSRP
jgi:diguanylate cyclase (GGDEF)-like protein